MKYAVMVMPEADQEMEQAYEWLLEQTPKRALRWYNGMIDAILSLEDFPARCPMAPENVEFSEKEIRQLLYGRRPHLYRILFSIQGSRVLVLHVRHGARDVM